MRCSLMRGFRFTLCVSASCALTAALPAQTPSHPANPAIMPSGIIRGHLLSVRGGIAEVQRDDGVTYDCNYDSHTLFERNRWPVRPDDLNAGEPVEILSDNRAGSGTCYVRMLSVVYKMPPPARRRTKIAPLEGEPETLSPAVARPAHEGYLSYSGTVTKYDGSNLTIHTRSGEETLHLRADTQYSNAGVIISAPESLVNQHVYVRGGRTLYGVLEAYQVMWGQIVMVH